MVPLHRFIHVGRNAGAVFKEHPEPKLSRSVALFGGTSVPLRSFGVVPRHALAIEIHVSKIVLSGGVAPLGGASEPPRGFGVVLRHAVSDAVHVPEKSLSGDVTLFRKGRYEFLEGLRRRRQRARQCHRERCCQGDAPDRAFHRRHRLHLPFRNVSMAGGRGSR